MPSPLHADDIANCVLKAFNALPRKLKPRQLADGRREWVPLAGIVLSRGETAIESSRNTPRVRMIADTLTHDREGHEATNLTCAALATGMKCLPLSKVSSARGNVLHDWHAEVLALRAFNRFLLDECAEFARKSAWVRRREGEPPFELEEDVKIHMYCSEAPCGDASMELIMASQEDATPWISTPPTLDGGGMLGRGHFDQLGIVRRKPSRPDAPVTLSKSCSDKIAMKQVTGLLSGLGSLLVSGERIYLETLVLPESQYVREGVERSFGAKGRMKGAKRLRPFEVKTTSNEFGFSRRAFTDAVPSNLSALWTPHKQEVLINGVLQGRKQGDPKGASCVSRRGMWKSVLEIAESAQRPALVDALKKGTYRGVKENEILRGRREMKNQVKEKALKGWEKNAEDHDWCLDE